MAQLVEVGPGPVNETERRVIELLVRGLPGAWVVVPNATLTEPSRGSGASGQAYEYDAIVLTGHAVYVVEVKGWEGTIRAVSRREWQLASGHYAANPLLLVDFKAKVLKGRLEELELRGPGGAELRTPYVMGCFVCGADDAVLDVFDDDRRRCLRPRELCAFIQDLSQLPVAACRDHYKASIRRMADHVKGRLKGRSAAPRRFGSYRVTSTESQREDAAVYHAVHAEFDDGRVYRVRTWWVSPYVFEPAERARRLKVLRRSAEALHLIGDHPNVVALRAFDQQEDCFFEVTDWSTTGTLATALSMGSTLKWPPERKLGLLLGIARALEAAQRKDIFHRDLRPTAVLLGPGGEPRVGEFDLAFMLSADETVYGEAALRPVADHPYRPPELRDPAGPDVFPSTDLYSLGRIAYDVLTGTQPKDDQRSKPPPLSTLCELPASIAGELDALVASMVEPDPDDRPADAAAVVAALESMLRALAAAPPGPEVDPVAARHAAGVYEPGERIDSGNLVIDVLGRGAGSTVYAVHNDVLQDELALKLVHGDGDRQGPFRELKLLTTLRHPGFVRAYWAGQLPGAGEEPGPTYLLMERLEGRTLAARLAEERTIPADEALRITAELAGALAALHGMSPPVVHRDLKPENIYTHTPTQLSGRGPVLADLGTAAPVTEAGAAPVGSLRYTPPDLAAAGWGPDADVFALATVAWQMLTGSPPWGAAAPSLDVAPGPLRADGLGSNVAAVLERAISPAKASRFADAAELLAALEAARAADAAPTPPPEPEPEREREPENPAVWTVDLVRSLGEASSLSQTLYAALRPRPPFSASAKALHDMRRARLAAEAFAMELERPLADILPSLYDELLEPSPPVPIAGEAEPEDGGAAEPQRLELGEGDVVLVLDGLSMFEVPLIEARAHELGRGLDGEWVWRAGPLDPALPTEGAGALVHAFGAGGLRDCRSIDDVEDALAPGRWGRLRLRLELGRRDDDLGALLERRAAVIGRCLAAASAACAGALWVTTTFGVVYLGQGLRLDVGAGAGERADQVRAAWRAAFPEGRTGRVSSSRSSDIDAAALEAPVFRPVRRSGPRLFPVGRLAWPDTPTDPRLACGGLSLPERLLPLLRFGAPKEPVQ